MEGSCGSPFQILITLVVSARGCVVKQSPRGWARPLAWKLQCLMGLMEIRAALEVPGFPPPTPALECGQSACNQHSLQKFLTQGE